MLGTCHRIPCLVGAVIRFYWTKFSRSWSCLEPVKAGRRQISRTFLALPTKIARLEVQQSQKKEEKRRRRRKKKKTRKKKNKARARPHGRPFGFRLPPEAPAAEWPSARCRPPPRAGCGPATAAPRPASATAPGAAAAPWGRGLGRAEGARQKEPGLTGGGAILFCFCASFFFLGGGRPKSMAFSWGERHWQTRMEKNEEVKLAREGCGPWYCHALFRLPDPFVETSFMFLTFKRN